jgi:NADH-quinone oxidoreductase subunit H
VTGSSLTQVSAAWVPLAAALVLVVAAVGAAFDGAVAARAEGVPWRHGAAAPLVETARLLRQRRRTTVAADRPLQLIGTGGLVVVALLMVVVVPLGRWTLGDLPVGVVWFNAMDVVVWAVVWLAGWGPNSAHALVGGYRFLAQALAYELPLMFAVTAPALAAGSLRVGDVVAAQEGLWFAVWMPVAFGVFCGAVLAFSVRGPFSAPAGTDLAGGVLADSSGPDRWLLLAGRWALMAAGSAFGAAVFLGGGHGPLLPSWLWSLVKTVALLAVLVWLRRRLPAVRPDRLLPIAWLVALPLVLLQLLVIAVVVVGRG